MISKPDTDSIDKQYTLEGRVFHALCKPQMESCGKHIEETFVSKLSLEKQINKVLLWAIGIAVVNIGAYTALVASNAAEKASMKNEISKVTAYMEKIDGRGNDVVQINDGIREFSKYMRQYLDELRKPKKK